MKKLFICCDREARERVVERAKNSIWPLSGSCRRYEPADMAYVVGKVTPDMQQEMRALEQKNLRTVKVNEDFINEELYEQVLKGKVHVKEKDFGRER